jgi:hypothetical protein
VLYQFCGCDLFAVIEDNDGAHFLAPAFARNAEDCGLGHRAMTKQDALHLGRIDVLPAADDHVLLAP